RRPALGHRRTRGLQPAAPRDADGRLREAPVLRYRGTRAAAASFRPLPQLRDPLSRRTRSARTVSLHVEEHRHESAPMEELGLSALRRPPLPHQAVVPPSWNFPLASLMARFTAPGHGAQLRSSRLLPGWSAGLVSPRRVRQGRLRLILSAIVMLAVSSLNSHAAPAGEQQRLDSAHRRIEAKLRGLQQRIDQSL